MFEKVLIAEDHESSNISIRKALADSGIKTTSYVYYCDDALSRVQQALKNNDPYELLITDLSFEDDGTPQTIKDGSSLIKTIKELQPEIKLIVFSAETRSAIIDQLFKTLHIDGYVRKARHDVAELKQALEDINIGKKYLSTGLRQSIRKNNTYQFTPYHIELITLLSKGVAQKNIPFHLQEKQIKPSGLSSVEKHLNAMREALNFTKNEQLVAFCKDIGLI